MLLMQAGSVDTRGRIEFPLSMSVDVNPVWKVVDVRDYDVVHDLEFPFSIFFGAKLGKMHCRAEIKFSTTLTDRAHERSCVGLVSLK